MPYNSFSIKVQRLIFETKKFYRNAWPINWSNLTKKDLVIDSIKTATYSIKMIIAVCLVGFLFSLTFFSLGAFEIMTVKVESRGGDFYEALVGSRLTNFNPVLNSSESEKKINNLLYHPLYRVDYPDFLSNPEQKPKITPILLSKEPEWSANPNNQDDKFYALNFELRNDIFWSDGTPITNQDIRYSFERIKEEGGNSDFRGIFQNYNIEIDSNSATKFKLFPQSASISANPQLKYMANFAPVSKSFYTNDSGVEMTNKELQLSAKSKEVEVTSGFFKISPKALDPETGIQIDNPKWNNGMNGYDQVVLTANTKQNYGKGVFLERYIFNVYDNIEDTGGNSKSLQRSSSIDRVDLYTRSLLSSNQKNSQEIKAITGLNQNLQATNTFLSMFFNVETSSTGYLINPNLRQYIACHFQDPELTTRFKESLEIIPVQKRSIPLHFNTDFTPDCSDPDKIITEYRNNSNQQVYTIDKDERGGIKRVKIFGNTQNLTLLSLQEFAEQAEWIRDVMSKAGLPMEANYVSSDDLAKQIQSGNYHIAFLPFTPSSADPYPIYGLSAQNISKISSSRDRTATEKIENGKKFEEVLEKYSRSSLEDKESKESLIDFFKNQSMGVNLFRTKREINYSSRINKLETIFDNFIVFPYQIYDTLPSWHIESRRKFRFF